MKIVSLIAYILVIIGALNWLIMGLFDFNLVFWVCGSMNWLARTVYTIVGVSGLWLIFYLFLYRPFRSIQHS